MQKKLEFLGNLGVFEASDYLYQKERYASFIYPSVCGNRIVRLFKVLLTNNCKFNCLYCANRRDRDCPRYSFDVYELAEIFYSMWKKKIVNGLFLSSGIEIDNNQTQEKMIDVIKILRKKYNYNDYIHLKILPGVDEYLIKKGKIYADRLSLNLESINSLYLKKISKEKDFSKNLLNTLKKLSDLNREKPLRNGITTQIIAGCSEESDKEIMSFSYYLYKNYNISRVYYSGFIPVLKTPFENKKPCSLQRQMRLYQADILIRKYKFLPSEIPFDKKGNLYLNKDPKSLWAEKNKEFFPLEINKASFYQLIRIPGIGIKTALKILEIRKESKIRTENILKKIGVKLKKVSPYILINGKKIKESENGKIESEIYCTIFDEVI
ncbi:MAG: radical SAM protein [Candidatus Omnitrophica bacterium]|nr:radical SAM protein [Candidatus Omnitrophota bacterium]MCM8802193.1 radical SAM protein [Candidatus Omnitrophota bacterium]